MADLLWSKQWAFYGRLVDASTSIYEILSSGFGNVKKMYKSSTFATKPLGTGLPSNDASFKQRLTEEVIYNIEERVI
jgi:hypothetical protein